VKAVFLDRDGVLNELVYYPDYDEDESPRRPSDLRLLPDVIPAMHELLGAGWTLFMVSNQPSYAKGKASLDDLKAVHKVLARRFKSEKVTVAQAYYSYTHPKGVVPEYTGESVYRKPNPAFLLDAARDYRVDLSASWMVGDRDSDVFCGQRAGTHTAQLRYPLSANKQGHSQPDWVCADLPEFVQKLLAQS
jgi:D-glycero-D-manno-heptose 1,7-bisphosphate phosphatase